MLRYTEDFTPSRTEFATDGDSRAIFHFENEQDGMHGGDDSIVPTWLGQELYLAAAEPKELYIIAGAGHNDGLELGGSEYLIRIEEFLRATGSAE